MRTLGVVSICLLLLASCGNDEEIAAKVTELKSLRSRYQALNTEFAQKHPERQKILDAVIPAKGVLMRAKRSEDKVAIEAAQAKFNEAESAANVVLSQEGDLKRRIRDLKDKIAAVERAIRKLGGKVPKPK